MFVLIHLFRVFLPSDSVCDTEFASNMTFKAVTSIINFYIPTACMICLYVRIFMAIKQRSNDIAKFGAYTASGGQPAAAAAIQNPNRGPNKQQLMVDNKQILVGGGRKQDEECKERSLDHRSK